MVVAAQLRSILVVGLWLAVMRPVPNWTGVMAGVGVGAVSCEHHPAVQLAERSPERAGVTAVRGARRRRQRMHRPGHGRTSNPGSRRPAGSSAWQASAFLRQPRGAGWRIPRFAHYSMRRSQVRRRVWRSPLIGLSAPSQLPWLLLFERLTTVGVLSALTKTRPQIRLSSGNEYGVWIVAVGYVAASWALHAGTVEAGLAVTAIIASCYPVVTIILSVFFDGERIGPWRILSLALALCGLAMLTAGHS